MTALPAQSQPLSRGWRRMREIARESAVEIAALTADLLQGLGRPATATDRITAEAIAAATVRARKLRSTGKDDFQERKQIAQLMRAAGGAFKPAAPAEAKPIETPLEYARRVAAERAAAAADSEAAQ